MRPALSRALLWPRSLAGQMALLIAIALFIAQAINFGMLLEGRRQLRVQQVVGPAVTRIMEATENLAARQPLPGERLRGGVRVQPDFTPGPRPVIDVERDLRVGLSEAGLRFGRIGTYLRHISPRDPRISRFGPRRAGRYARMGAELIIGVEQTDGRWLVLSTPWQRSDAPLFWTLIAQTLILYGIVLLPVLWIGRRISRPLRTLADAARRFVPGEVDVPVDERGPHDLRAVISAFNALRLRVTAMLDEKDRMLGAIGHDLRTPLAALRVRIESVEDETDRAKMADTIEEMNRTLDDILSLARLGRPSEPLTEVDLSALVDAVVEDFRDIGSDVTFDEETPRLQLRLRPSLMRRAVRNLIENALKYAGSAAVSIVVAPREVQILVADNGPGIPDDRLGDVFEAFTRLETSRNKDTGGIGLGLALARAIVVEAGGDIRLINRPEGGLAATIALPR